MNTVVLAPVQHSWTSFRQLLDRFLHVLSLDSREPEKNLKALPFWAEAFSGEMFRAAPEKTLYPG
ncbi:MAG TPA: hypothetical protein VNE63_19250 [Candidatus Acidoferrales bacterium]|nr:hypothetical protein [Candidatus Acidoferrales bacterium]